MEWFLLPAPGMSVKTYRCESWDQVREAWRGVRRALDLRAGEEAWYRGVPAADLALSPSLLWRFAQLPDKAIDRLEQNLFFEFQARARELHERGLSDWDYLFFMRHHGVPTRILDWTDSFSTALYFALESQADGATPCVWVLNPYALNEQTWNLRDLIQPKFLGYVTDDDPWDYGDLIGSRDPWHNDGPVAIYPLQISERMRAQRGWFTIFGNDRRALEQQFPAVVARIELRGAATDEAAEFLAMAGIRPYAVYPDLDHLGVEVVQSNADWVEVAASRRSPRR